MVRNQNATTIIKKLDLLLFPQFALPVSLLLLYQNCYHQLTGFSGLFQDAEQAEQLKTSVLNTIPMGR
jgi:hypothetical protein